LLALSGAHHILHVSRIRVNGADEYVGLKIYAVGIVLGFLLVALRYLPLRIIVCSAVQSL
jgi:hypothetical protein